MFNKFNKFNKIEQFRAIIKERNSFYPELQEAVFTGTIKIHGTNAAIGVNVETKEVFFQSRNRIITPDDDNLGFAAWANQWTFDWLALAKFLANEGIVYFFGEWFGPGIQKGVGVSELTDRHFAIFEVQAGGKTFRKVPNLNWPPQTHSIFSFQTFDVFVDFSKPYEVQKHFHDLTMQIEAQCPVAKTFGIEGTGEGLVWTAFHEKRKIQFKTKGEKHSATKVKTIADVDVEHYAKLQEFVNASVTETRLDQGLSYLTEMGKDISLQNIGDFLKWVSNDVMLEERDVITANNFDEKKVNKAVTALAVSWYKSQCA